MTRKVKVYSNQDAGLVGSLQHYLMQHNIHAEIRNQYTSSVMGEAAFFDAWPELWVFAEHFDQAAALLEEVTAPHNNEAKGPDWLCNNCRENNPVNFELCWQCNTAR